MHRTELATEIGECAMIDKPPTLAALRARRAEILALADKYRAFNVRVFGSVARGEATPESDMDLLVSFRVGVSLLDVVAFIQDVGDLLELRVDAVDDRAIKPRLRVPILKDARVL
jgi:uncharacterized protein